MSSQRSALVTGSARGIGLAIATDLAAAGHRVTGLDILPQESGPCDMVIEADLADPSVPAEIVRTHGPFGVLVNNAGLFIHQSIEAVRVEDFDRQIAVNLRATFLLSQSCAPQMEAGGWGRIINISSVGARTGGISESAVYNATKAGIISLTKNLARVYGPAGVTANAVAPGAVDSFMTEHISDQQRAEYTEQIPLRRFSSPDEVASVVTFLASDKASYINGAVLDVNGGWVMP